MALTIPIIIFNNAKHGHVIYLKFESRFFTFVVMLGLEAKASICSPTKEKLLLYCRKLTTFAKSL